MFSNLLAQNWWLLLLRGAAWIVFGIMVFAQPGISLATLLLMFGAFVLADGLGNVVTAVSGRKQNESWGFLLLQGLVGIGVGLLTFSNPLSTALMLLFYIAIWAIGAGVLQIASAIRLRKEIEGEVWLALCGLLSVAFGVFLIARPGAGALSVLWMIGSFGIVFGTTLIVLGFKVHSFANRVATAVKA